jgi:hypothetical protein
MQMDKPERLESRKVNWWLRMTSAGWDAPQETIQQRERARRSALLSWILLGLFIALILFIPATLTDAPSAFSVGFAFVGLLLIVWLNRKGFVTTAGVLMVALVIAATMSVVVGSPDHAVHLVYLPAYDFLVISVVLGAAVLPRSSAFIIAAVNITLIYADLLLQSKSKDLLDAISMYGLPTLAGRPVVIQVITAVIAFLWARGMDEAVRRADRAEELRTIEQHFAEAEIARTKQVEEFVQEMISAISALANGQEGLMLLSASHPWQQQATFINMQLKQFYRLKQANRGDNEQIAHAAEMLLIMVQRISRGQSAISDLAPGRFSTQVPVVNEIAGYFHMLLQGRQGAAQPPVQRTSAQQAPFPRSASRPLRTTRPVPPSQTGQ